MTLVAIIPQRMRLSVTEIWRFKDNGVTTLSFWGHVTSSVTWPFDSRESTSYGWSIVTMRLSSTVMEIWPFEVLRRRSSVGPQYYTDLIYSFRYVRKVSREE